MLSLSRQLVKWIKHLAESALANEESQSLGCIQNVIRFQTSCCTLTPRTKSRSTEHVVESLWCEIGSVNLQKPVMEAVGVCQTVYTMLPCDFHPSRAEVTLEAADECD